MANSFEIKSAQLQLVALLLKSSALAQVAQDLLTQFGPESESPDFFDNDPLVVDFSHAGTDLDIDDLPQLIQALQNCRLKPLTFRAAKPNHVLAITSQGLLEVPPDLPKGKPAFKQKAQPQPAAEVIREVVREVVKEVVREVPGPAALVIDKPLRSGQKIYARGTDLVMLAMVNQGAEVAADGNIHVYAPLRGKAMAGASGNVHARIFSTCLEPELISIAGVYRTSENPLAPHIQGKAAQVRLSDDGQEKLLFEPLSA